jgi:putative aldouronate transport system substrate-binding protein
MEHFGYEYVEPFVAIDPRDPDRGAFNILEDEAAVGYILSARRFYEEGLIDPAPKADSPEALTLVGQTAYYDELEPQYAVARIGAPGVDTCRSAVGVYANTKNFERVMQLLEWLYTDRELADYLVYGSVNANSTPDTGSLTVFRWLGGLYLFTSPAVGDPADKVAANDKFSEDMALTPVTGFHFMSSGWEETVGGLRRYARFQSKQTVLVGDDMPEYYMSDLLTGYVPDPMAAIAHYNAELKALGIDELVAEVNRQFDAWRVHARG